MNRPSDKQLRNWIQGISDSDQQAFDRLFRYLYPRLMQYCLRYTRNRAAAADIVQDAFVTLWNVRQELDRNFSVKAYLYRVVRNDSLNYIRDHSSRTVSLEEKEMESELEKSRTGPETNQSDNSEINLKMNLLKVWIEELPNRRREAFELSRFEGLEHDEIAEVMEISSNTVNNHIVAALDYLKDRCHEYREKVNNANF